MDVNAILKAAAMRQERVADQTLISLVSKEADLLMDELLIHAQGGFVAVPEEVVKRVADMTMELRVTAPERGVAGRRKLATKFRLQRVEFARARELFALAQKLSIELHTFAKNTNMPAEQLDELKAQLTKCATADEARRLIGRIIHPRTAKAQPQVVMSTAARDQVVEEESGEEPTEFRVACLQTRAARVKSTNAEQLYAAGLTAANRRDKIRLFKAAIHEERAWNKKNPRAKRR